MTIGIAQTIVFNFCGVRPFWFVDSHDLHDISKRIKCHEDDRQSQQGSINKVSNNISCFLNTNFAPLGSSTTTLTTGEQAHHYRPKRLYLDTS